MKKQDYKNKIQNRGRRGSAMVELALCLLLCVMMIYAVMEFGRIVYSHTVLAGATREASRYAIVHGGRSSSPATSETIRQRVAQWAVGLDTSALVVNTTWSPSNAPGSTVLVQSTYNLRLFSGLLRSGTFALGSRSEMVISQ